ncbi:coiled-coil domain-containing protein 27 isoform X2 [Erinaceus europaeus]|uniref:Coiled-coil domain-containing protein 27 isoform X2 n=1 Tax=Erinaceus europaeus TaxID=9365 RepID=A0ABM3Y884_ERIEU|nr:coiled-coil domain-containing protein 27 isoform X2 [Erinaceus europaeus]
MLPKKVSRPKNHILMPDLMAKGLLMLQSVAGRDNHTPPQKLSKKQRSQSKSAQAVNRYYRKMSEVKPDIYSKDIIPKDTSLEDPSSEDTSFLSEMEKLRKAFLLRPGCPQLNTRATSISQCGMAMALPQPKVLSIDSEHWKDDLSSQQEDVKVDEPLPFSKSACEFHYLRQRSQSNLLSPVSSRPSMEQPSSRRRMPWYISVIHEKDHCLFMLGEEVHRLSELKVQILKKDREIQALQEEKEALKKQLKDLLKSKSQDMTFSQGSKETGIISLIVAGGGEEPEVGISEEQEGVKREDERATDEVSKSSADSKESAPEARGVQEEEEEEEEKDHEEEDTVIELDEEKENLNEEWRRSRSMEDTFEEELMMHLGEFERVMQEFQFELEVTRARYSLATVDYQESQLQKINWENELLEKELRERKCQLQTMSDKFSNLREEKKQAEMLGLVEKDNLNLRQKVSDLETELTKRDQTIADFNIKVNQLQEQVKQHQNHLQRWKQLQEDMQNRNETIHQAEQQLRVALESVQSRLERLRSKIIQAAFNITGIKSTSTEISDNDILEALQTIITERTDYYNQLKQKGIKMPPLHPSEIFSSVNKIKKTVPK